MTVGSLFAGIGGFDLGLERAGMEIRWQVEIDPFCQAVLAKHWPHVSRYDDVRTVGAHNLERVDVLCGGWPCQPVSSASAGRRKGTEHDAWLWPEMSRVLAQLQPAWFFGENVVALDRGELDAVVSDLEGLGYEVAPTLEVPACAFGFDHWRARYWILGYAHRDREPGVSLDAEMARMSRRGRDSDGLGTASRLSRGMDGYRLRTLGNAVVPQIVEWIGRQIVAADANARVRQAR
jgi:DNA (cytosine-5)-methyltransferase 1